jgi:hypothetical protein
MMANVQNADGLRGLAARLENGQKGDPATMSDALAMLLRCEAQRQDTGYVTPDECIGLRAEFCDKLKARFGWPAYLAVLTGCGTLIGVVHLIIKS